MKMQRISEHIWSLKTWIIIPIHVWVVVDVDGVVLVDAGISGMANGILKGIDSLNAGPLQKILLTHGHSDHVGSVNKMVNSRHVSVYAHKIELPYINGELPYPRRKKSEPHVRKGTVQPLIQDEQGVLEPVAGLKPYLTPGHAPGHVVYYHEQDQVLLAGDLFTSKNGKLRRPMPMFTADMAEALKSSTIVKQLAPVRVEVCHGEPVLKPAEQMDEYIRETSVAFSIPFS